MPRLSTEERQKIIIDEAIKIIHEGGYQALSIRELAQRVKISEPAIYRHFVNKEDIILGILNRMLEFEHKLEASLFPIQSNKDKIKNFMLFHFEFLEKNREMTSILFSEDIFNQSEVLRTRMMFIINKRKKMLSDIITEAMNDGEINGFETDEILTVIFGVIRRVVLEWRLGGFNFSLIESGKKTINTIEKIITN